MGGSVGGATLAERAPRLDSLTGLRWWAAFMVFFYHVLVFAPVPGITAIAFGQGFYGVTFFFILSGFVLTWSARPGVSTSTFYWRRFARIYPTHIVALLLAIPVFYTLGTVPPGSFLKSFDPGVLALSFVLLQGWSLVPIILFSGNPAAWTLTVEAFFYALHPWLMRLLVRISRRGAIVAGVAVIVLMFALKALRHLPGSPLTAVPLPIGRLPEFLLGMCIAWALRSGWRPRIHPLVGLVAGAGGLALIIVVFARFQNLPTLSWVLIYANEIVTLGFAIAILAVAQGAIAGRRSAFASRWQVKLGELSFAFYLVHATVIYAALRVFGSQPPSWQNVLWYVPLLIVILALTWVIHHAVEQPLERRMRRWKDARDARRGAASAPSNAG